MKRKYLFVEQQQHNVSIGIHYSLYIKESLREDDKLPYSAIANVNTLIRTPSISASREAHATVVAPVVNTSSTINICFPAKSPNDAVRRFHLHSPNVLKQTFVFAFPYSSGV